MPMIIRNECPCQNCKHHTEGEYDLHFCNKKQRAIYQHHGNAYHRQGQWIIPCNMHSFKKKAFDCE